EATTTPVAGFGKSTSARRMCTPLCHDKPRNVAAFQGASGRKRSYRPRAACICAAGRFGHRDVTMAATASAIAGGAAPIELVISKLLRAEGVAPRDRAVRQAGREPALALFSAAMGEGVRHHIALHFLLQAIVADRGRCLQRLIDVAGIEEFVLLLRMIGP